MAEREPRHQVRCQESSRRAAETPCATGIASQPSCVDVEFEENRGRSLYIEGRPANRFREPRKWLLQTLSWQVIRDCEDRYWRASDSEKRPWLALWRTFKAAFEAFLTKDDKALEYLGSAASEVLRHVDAKHRTPDDPWATRTSLESIGLDCEHQFGDVPFGVEWGRERAVQVLLNTLRESVLKQVNEYDPSRSGQDGRDHRHGWHPDPSRCAMAWETSMTPEKFANMAPGWGAIVHEVTVAAPSKRPAKRGKAFRPGSPLKSLVPDDRARFFGKMDDELPTEMRAKLKKAFRAFQRDTRPRDLRDSDEPLKPLARDMLKALGASNAAAQDLFRIEETAQKVGDRRAAKAG